MCINYQGNENKLQFLMPILYYESAIGSGKFDKYNE